MRSSLPAAVGFVGVKRAEALKGERSVFLHCRAAVGEKRYSRARKEREHGGRRTELSTENPR